MRSGCGVVLSCTGRSEHLPCCWKGAGGRQAGSPGRQQQEQRFLGSRRVGALTGQLPRQEGRGQVGVDAGSLRFVSRKAERVLHV